MNWSERLYIMANISRIIMCLMLIGIVIFAVYFLQTRPTEAPEPKFIIKSTGCVAYGHTINGTNISIPCD